MNMRQKTLSPSEIRAARLAEVDALQQIVHAFANPHTFKQGDLVQMRRGLLIGSDDLDWAPIGIVLALIDDLGAVTQDEEDIGLPGLRLARMAEDLEAEFACDPLWWFEPYTGPRPDAH